jgi:hypothetical protein
MVAILLTLTDSFGDIISAIVIQKYGVGCGFLLCF